VVKLDAVTIGWPEEKKAGSSSPKTTSPKQQQSTLMAKTSHSNRPKVKTVTELPQTSNTNLRTGKFTGISQMQLQPKTEKAQQPEFEAQ
jgi:hypothetical protein